MSRKTAGKSREPGSSTNPDAAATSIRQSLQRKQRKIIASLAVYLILGLLWIFLSDQFLFIFWQDAATLRVLSVLKGTLFVLFSSLPFYLMLRQRHAFWQGAYNELDARESQAFRQAYLDALTRLPNRAYLEEAFRKHVLQAQDHARKAAVIYFDIDELREVNELCGYAAGDQLLRMTAAYLKSSVRPENLVVRLAFDEFVILVAPLSGTDEAVTAELNAYVERVWQQYQQQWRFKDHSFYLTASIGAALYPEHGHDLMSLLHNAETAMLTCKQANKNDYCLYSSQIQLQTGRRTEQLTLMRKALSEDQFRLYYQPQFDLKSGELRGLEALIRWQHPQRGLVSPGQFIPLAEASGLIVSINDWVIRAVSRQKKAWLEEQICPGVIAINVSSRRFCESNLEAQLLPILDGSQGLCQGLLEVEITETAMLEDPEEAIQIMGRLRDKGITFSLDDFGSGYASLNYLRRLPLDCVKIERQFVQSMLINKNDALIIRSIIDLAHNLGLIVIAEGVETAEQLNHLCTLGCDVGQGYHLGMPLPAEAITDLLREKKLVLQPARNTDSPTNTER